VAARVRPARCAAHLALALTLAQGVVSGNTYRSPGHNHGAMEGAQFPSIAERMRAFQVADDDKSEPSQRRPNRSIPESDDQPQASLGPIAVASGDAEIETGRDIDSTTPVEEQHTGANDMQLQAGTTCAEDKYCAEDIAEEVRRKLKEKKDQAAPQGGQVKSEPTQPSAPTAPNSSASDQSAAKPSQVAEDQLANAELEVTERGLVITIPFAHIAAWTAEESRLTVQMTGGSAPVSVPVPQNVAQATATQLQSAMGLHRDGTGVAASMPEAEPPRKRGQTDEVRVCPCLRQ
jgi:hypothetical protein